MPIGEYVGWLLGVVGITLGELRARDSSRQLDAIADVVSQRHPRRDAARAIGVATDDGVRRLIGVLPQRERLLFALFWFDGLSLTEIADAFGIPVERAGRIHANTILKLRAVSHLATAA